MSKSKVRSRLKEAVSRSCSSPSSVLSLACCVSRLVGALGRSSSISSPRMNRAAALSTFA